MNSLSIVFIVLIIFSFFLTLYSFVKKSYIATILSSMLVLLFIILLIWKETNKDKDWFDPTVLTHERPLIWFHHVHKAGGTSFVKLAEANGEKMYYKGESRNGMPTNKYGYFLPFGNLTRTEQAEFIKDAVDNGTTFMATEFDFPKPEEKYRGTVDVIMLRDPLKRLVSHLSHLIREPESTRKDFNQRDPDEIIKENVPFFANIMTKVLSGHSFNYAGELTDKDYERALENLKSFDTLLILEDPQSLLKMQKYGWKNFNLTRQNESSKRDFQTNIGKDTTRKTGKILRKLHGPHWKKELRKISKYDQKLYDYASNQSYKGFK